MRHERVRAAEMFELIDADRARLSRHLPWVAWTQSAEDEQSYVDAVSDQWERLEFFDYAMFCGPTYLGNIGVHSINWHVGTAEIGYWILGPHEGRGFVTEACGALVDLCFERGFHRVEIRCDPANERSARVPRRLGFRLEATLRENAVDQHGRHHDTLVFARLRDDVSSESARASDATVDRGGRPACVSHWTTRDLGPQSYYPESLETFGDVAPLARDLADFEITHHVLPTGRQIWWPHAERDRDVCVFVLEGRLDLWLDGELHGLTGGDVVTLRRGTGLAHSLINEGRGDARLLVVRSKSVEIGAVHFPLHPELRDHVALWWENPPKGAGESRFGDSGVANLPPDLI